MSSGVKETNLTLLIGLGLLLGLMTALVSVSVSEILTVRAELNRVVDTKLVKSQLAQTMFDASRERALIVMMLQYEEDPFERDELMMRFQADAEKFMLAREQLFEMDLSVEERKALTDSMNYAASGAEAMNRLLELMFDEFEMDIDLREEASRLMRERIIPARAKVGERMMEIGWMVREAGEQAVTDVEQSYRRTWQLLAALGTAILLLSVAIIWVVYSRIMLSSKQIHRMYEELDTVASYDELTGLVNRRTFEIQFDQSIEQMRSMRQQLALLYLDLDGFKDINDTLGHAVGDQVLQHVAGQFLRQVRDNDMVGRLGGDEFAIVLTHIHEEERVRDIAQRILESVSAPLSLEDGLRVKVGVSIGVALYPDHGNDQEELLQQADRAMYIAKGAGKGAIRFAQSE